MSLWQKLFGSARRREPSAEDLITSLANSDPAIRLKAAVELHRHSGEATVSALISALADADVEVRGAAVESLRLLQDRRAVQPLIKVLETDTEHTPAYNAIKALGYIRTPESIAALVSALERRKGDASALAFELGEARANAGVEPLIRLLQDGTPYQRKQAVTALARIGDTRALKPLERALDDADEGVRERVQSVIEPPATRLWCAICGDWADAHVSEAEPRTCARCGKQNITEMEVEVRFRQLTEPTPTAKRAAEKKCERCRKPASYLLSTEIRLAGSTARSKVLQVCDKCFTELATGAVDIRLE